MSEPTISNTSKPIARPSLSRFTKDTAVGKICFFTLSILCLFLMLRHSDTAIFYMSQGLVLCAKTVIPSLFPFMVLSELLVASGGGEILGKLCERPFRGLFGISGSGVCALLMGLICGFPVGAKTAVSLCRRGEIDTAELSRLLCFCNIPSSAFLINVIGVSLFGSRRFGIMLYGICLIAALLTARLLQCLYPLTSHRECDTFAPPTMDIGVFTHAVTSAATAMLYVCAYVVFFTALVGTLGELLEPFHPNHALITALFGFFELSGGVVQASGIQNAALARWMTAFLCGWSGLSVHLQILSLCEDLPDRHSVRTRSYFLCKLFQGFLCALLCGLMLYFIPSPRLSVVDPHLNSVIPAFSRAGIVIICNVSLILLFGAIPLRRILKRHKKRSVPQDED